VVSPQGKTTFGSSLAAEEAVGGGEALKRCAFDLRLSEGVASEDEARFLRGPEAGPRMGLRDPAVSPADKGGFDGRK
jgi:hypothetical protein